MEKNKIIYRTKVDDMTEEERKYLILHQEDIDYEETPYKYWPKYEWEFLGFYAYLNKDNIEIPFDLSYSKKIGGYIKEPVIRFHIYSSRCGINMSSAIKVKKPEYYYNETWFPDKLPREIVNNITNFLKDDYMIYDVKIWDRIIHNCQGIIIRKREVPDYSKLQ